MEKEGNHSLERILIVSAADKAYRALCSVLTGGGVSAEFSLARSGAEARRGLAQTEYSLIFVNTPLPDEFGHELAQAAAHETLAGVLLLAAAEVSDAVSEKVELDGVFVLPKPLDRVMLFQALRMARAARSRLTGLQSENRKLLRRIEDIRLVDRAKCLLIECRGMTEPEAHAYIERRAMDRRQTKRAAAEAILNGEA